QGALRAAVIAPAAVVGGRMSDLRSVAFPTLDETQIAMLQRCAHGSLRGYPDGHTLIKVGDRDFKFYVVKSGGIEILDESGDSPRPVTRHGPGQFTGDVSHLTGGRALITAVTRGECELYEVAADD